MKDNLDLQKEKHSDLLGDISDMMQGAEKDMKDLPAPPKEKIPKPVKVANWMRAAHDIEFNTITHRYTEGTESVNTYDLLIEASEYFSENITETDISNAMQSSTVHRRVDPFRNYFDSLPKWDGLDHIGALSKYVEVKENKGFFKTMLKKHLVRAVGTGYDGIENRMVFTLISEAQEIGKTRFIRFLNPFKKLYYCDETLRDEKDSTIALCRNFIYNLEELEELTPRELSKLKAIISKKDISVRLPYARQEETLSRRCTFFASTNKSDFLVDSSNTRFLCFEVDRIDWSYADEVDINKVWAQAFHLFKKGSYDLTDDEKAARDMINEGHKNQTEEGQLLAHLFEPAPKDSIHFLSNSQIKAAISNRYPNAKLNIYKIGKALSDFGFIQDRKKVDGATLRGAYCVTKGEEAHNEL